ncbi:hypothetical protein NFJ02_30g76970 [Pycnococcus provasolii]
MRSRITTSGRTEHASARRLLPDRENYVAQATQTKVAHATCGGNAGGAGVTNAGVANARVTNAGDGVVRANEFQPEKARFHRAEIYAIKELGGVDREGVVKVDQADESRVGLIDAFEVEMAERATAPMY